MRRLDNFERLSVLLMAQDKDYYVDPEKVAKWVAYGDEWALRWEYDLFDREDHPKDEVVTETTEIFEMFRHIERSRENFTDPKNGGDLEFEGFDGNNDEHFHIASVIVKDLGRFDEIKNATSNSHSIATLQRYRVMLANYRRVRETRGDVYNMDPLSNAELQEILKR